MNRPIVYTAEDPAHLAGAYALSMAIAKGDPVTAQAHAEALGRHTTAEHIKSAVAAGDSASYAAVMQSVFGPFVSSVVARSIPGRMVGLIPAVLRARVAVGTGSARASIVGEISSPAPMTAGSFALTTVPTIHIEGTAVVSSEVLRVSHQQAQAIIERELSIAVLRALNLGFMDSSGAGITVGAPTVQSTGSTLAEVDADLKAVLALAIGAGIELESPVWVLHPQSAVYLAALRGSGGEAAFEDLGVTGGAIFGVPAITSSAVGRIASPGERFIALCDASQILFAPPEQVELSLARNVSVQMVDVPTPGATSLVSLWQAGLIALRAQAYCGWSVARSGACCVLDNVLY